MKRSFRSDDDSELDLTPMLDVVFILLIFFIVTTSFVKETGISVNRPSAATAEKQAKGNILVAIRPNGDVWMDSRHIDIRAVRAHVQRLKAQFPESSVIVQSDRDARTDVLIQVMDQVRLAGVVNISIAAANGGQR